MLQSNFQKGGLDRTSIFRGERVAEKEGKVVVTIFRGVGGCNFYVKNKLKSEIFNIFKNI